MELLLDQIKFSKEATGYNLWIKFQQLIIDNPLSIFDLFQLLEKKIIEKDDKASYIIFRIFDVWKDNCLSLLNDNQINSLFQIIFFTVFTYQHFSSLTLKFFYDINVKKIYEMKWVLALDFLSEMQCQDNMDLVPVLYMFMNVIAKLFNLLGSDFIKDVPKISEKIWLFLEISSQKINHFLEIFETSFFDPNIFEKVLTSIKYYISTATKISFSFFKLDLQFVQTYFFMIPIITQICIKVFQILTKVNQINNLAVIKPCLKFIEFAIKNNFHILLNLNPYMDSLFSSIINLLKILQGSSDNGKLRYFKFLLLKFLYDFYPDNLDSSFLVPFLVKNSILLENDCQDFVDNPYYFYNVLYEYDDKIHSIFDLIRKWMMKIPFYFIFSYLVSEFEGSEEQIRCLSYINLPDNIPENLQSECFDLVLNIQSTNLSIYQMASFLFLIDKWSYFIPPQISIPISLKSFSSKIPIVLTNAIKILRSYANYGFLINHEIFKSLIDHYEFCLTQDASFLLAKYFDLVNNQEFMSLFFEDEKQIFKIISNALLYSLQKFCEDDSTYIEVEKKLSVLISFFKTQNLLKYHNEILEILDVMIKPEFVSISCLLIPFLAQLFLYNDSSFSEDIVHLCKRFLSFTDNSVMNEAFDSYTQILLKYLTLSKNLNSDLLFAIYDDVLMIYLNIQNDIAIRIGSSQIISEIICHVTIDDYKTQPLINYFSSVQNVEKFEEGAIITNIISILILKSFPNVFPILRRLFSYLIKHFFIATETDLSRAKEIALLFQDQELINHINSFSIEHVPLHYLVYFHEINSQI